MSKQVIEAVDQQALKALNRRDSVEEVLVLLRGRLGSFFIRKRSKTDPYFPDHWDVTAEVRVEGRDPDLAAAEQEAFFQAAFEEVLIGELRLNRKQREALRLEVNFHPDTISSNWAFLFDSLQPMVKFRPNKEQVRSWKRVTYEGFLKMERAGIPMTRRLIESVSVLHIHRQMIAHRRKNGIEDSRIDVMPIPGMPGEFYDMQAADCPEGFWEQEGGSVQHLHGSF